MPKESFDLSVSSRRRWQMVLHEVIFEADTRAGKIFDVLLIVSILASVAAVMLDSITAVRIRLGGLLYGIEWFFTLLFTGVHPGMPGVQRRRAR